MKSRCRYYVVFMNIYLHKTEQKSLTSRLMYLKQHEINKRHSLSFRSASVNQTNISI